MPEKAAQPLSLPALFYDIIFSFIIGRLAGTLIFTSRGILDWRSGITFSLMMLCAWTVWTYQVIYASRTPANPLRDALYLSLNIGLGVYLTAAVKLGQALPLLSTKLATTGLFLLLALQYRAFPGRHQDSRVLRLSLLIASVFSLIAVVPKTFWLGSSLYTVAVLIAALGPWAHFHRHPHKTTHFKTVIQRLALFTALLFGRAIIDVTDSFADLSVRPVLFFCAMILLFASYGLVIIVGIDKETSKSSMLALLLHLPLVTSVLMMAGITRMSLTGRMIPTHFALWILSLLTMYTIVLGLLLLHYPRPGVILDSRRALFYGVAIAILTLYGLVTANIGAAFLLGTCAYLVACDLYLWQFVLNAGEIDG